MNFVTFSDLNKDIVNGITKIPKDVDLVIGIPRSGMLSAGLIALYLNVPMTDIDAFCEGRIYRTGNTRKCLKNITEISQACHALIVDDSIASGASMKQARTQIKDSGKRIKLTFLAIYGISPLQPGQADIVLKNIGVPRVFEWNYLHHRELENCCLDIDGVLCEDPNLLQNALTSSYVKFILNAKPKLIPTKKVGWLISSRSEMYKKETKQWLKNQNVDYNELVLMPKNRKSEALTNADYAKYKGEIYARLPAGLFIESNLEQAGIIRDISKKQVFSIENSILLAPSDAADRIAVAVRSKKSLAKYMIKRVLRRSQKQ